MAALRLADVAASSLSAEALIMKVSALSINPLNWKIVQGKLKLMSGKNFPKAISIDVWG